VPERGRLAALIAAGLLAACNGSGGESSGSILRAHLNSDLVSSDPGMRRDLNTDAVMLHVVEGLVASREDGSVGPMLARSWTVSPDGRVYRFALRPGIRFHNGKPLTSDDVLWSFKRYLAEGSSWRCKGDLSGGLARIVRMAAPDPLAFELELEKPAPLLLKTLARSDCGSTGISHRDSVGKDGEWRYPIGTGPFRWGEWRRNQYVELLRFKDYKPLPGGPDGSGGGKKALVDRVRFVIIPDGSSASAALIRGSIDVVDGVQTGELGALRGNPDLRIQDAPSMDLYAMLFQVRDPRLADPRLRRAIALSLDVGRLARVATRGTATGNSSPVSLASPFSKAAQRTPIRRDLDAARALARAAGYKGEPIALIASRAPPEMFDAAIIAQAMAREAGINFEIVSLDWATHLARYSSGNYQAMVFGYSARLDPSLMYGAFTGDKAKDPRKVWGTPGALALLRRSQEEGDPAKRQLIFDEMERLFREEAPAVALYNSRRLAAVRREVHDYRIWSAQLIRLWNVSVERD
jgi:peptide/nickel transport system substrate-binding protein